VFQLIELDPYTLLRPWKIYSDVEKASRRRQKAVEQLKESEFDTGVLGNLRFEGKKLFQDRAEPAEDVLENFRIFPRNVQLSMTTLICCMRCGVSDSEIKSTILLSTLATSEKI
jgi:hypothetical protein